MRDVAIVGGGPGGLHVASLLARRGFEVSVYEEHRSSGAPVHCTGVLSADAFDRFENEGIFNRDTGAAYRKSILAVGGSRPALESFVEFRGREPKPDALLRSYGLA